MISASNGMMDVASQLESLLLLSGEPIAAQRLAKVLKRPVAEVEAALKGLEAYYKERGIRLISAHGAWQFGTSPENAGVVEDFVKSEFSEELSKAALETLSVIAYKGPLMRAQIEYIRGVNSSFSIRNLMLRGLVFRIDNPKDARSYLYRVSIDFLKHLGLTSVEELPEWREFHLRDMGDLPDNSKETSQ